MSSDAPRPPDYPKLTLPANFTADDASVEMSSRRTGMSFQRTRLSAERTLMSVIRTALSLIGFGFTIFQFFQKMHDSGVVQSGHAARRFGEALVLLGIAILAVGIAYHVAFMRQLRAEREMLRRAGLVHAESAYPVSYTLVIAFLVATLGFLAIGSMWFGFGPF